MSYKPFSEGDIVYLKDPKRWIGMKGDTPMKINLISVDVDGVMVRCEWQEDYRWRGSKWFSINDLSHTKHCEHEFSRFVRTALVCSECARVVGGF